MKDTIIWTAVSDVRQGNEDKTSLASQEEVCREYCGRVGLKVRSVIVSKGSRSSRSPNPLGTTKNPAYHELKRLVALPEIKHFVYDRWDRVARDALWSEQVARECLSNSVVLHEATTGSVIDNINQDPLERVVKAYSADQAARNTGMVSLRARIKRNEGGKFPNRPPYGYREVFASDGKFDKYVNVPEEQEVVLKIFEHYLSLGGVPAVYKQMKQDGINITREQIRVIVRNVWMYAGYVVMYVGRGNRKGYSTPVDKDPLAYKSKGLHDAIISDDYARKVEEEAVKRSANNGLGRTPSKFSRMVFCTSCANTAAMRTSRYYRKKTDDYAVLYRCQHPDCEYQGRSVHADVVARAIMEKLEGELASLIDVDISDIPQDDSPSIESQIATINKKIAGEDRKLLNIARRFAETGDDAVFETVQAEIEARKAELQRQLEEVKSQQPKIPEEDRKTAIEHFIEFIREESDEAVVNSTVRDLMRVDFNPETKESTVRLLF